MKLENGEQLRHMNAKVYDGYNIELLNEETCELAIIRHGIVFKSYKSICAVYDYKNDILYLLPRYDFSLTTIRQLKAFCDDYTNVYYNSIKDLRAIESGKDESDNIKYMSGYKVGWQLHYYQAILAIAYYERLIGYQVE